MSTYEPNIPVSQYNENDNVGMTFAYTMFDNDNPVDHERYAFSAEAKSIGSGNGAVSATTYAASLVTIKKNWEHSVVPGQTGALRITARGGYHGAVDGLNPYTDGSPGDTSAISTQVITSSPTDYQCFHECDSFYAPSGDVSGTAPGSLRIRTYSGVIKPQLGYAHGYVANAIKGNVNTGFLSTDSTGAWAYHFRGVNSSGKNVFSVDPRGKVTGSNFFLFSDYRIKKNVVAANTYDQLRRVRMLNPVTYNLPESTKLEQGFIAHEVMHSFPHIVTGVKDGVELQTVDYTALIPSLVAAIQEMAKRIEYLERRI